ncbi:MAG: TPM domain-containing protein [Bacteroidota bacterium]
MENEESSIHSSFFILHSSFFINSVVNFFSTAQEQSIIAAIKEAERQTSGEIRVHLERELIGDALTVAARVFHELEMDTTEERNGVLIFIVPSMHRFAIIGDSGINEKVPPNFWDDIRDVMQDNFRQGKFTAGVIEGVRRAGTKLKEFFPRKTNDKNELPDEISYG